MTKPEYLRLPSLTLVLLLSAPAASAQVVEFGDIDANNDGVLDAAELLAVFDVEGLSLMSRDRNGDAVVSRAELRDGHRDEDARPERRGTGYAAASSPNRAHDRNDADSNEGSSSPDLGGGASAATTLAAGGDSAVSTVGNADPGQGGGAAPKGGSEGAPGNDLGDAGRVGSDTDDSSTSSDDDTGSNDADQGQGSGPNDGSQGGPSPDGEDQGDAGTGSTAAASSSDDEPGADGSLGDSAPDQGESDGMNSADGENPS